MESFAGLELKRRQVKAQLTRFSTFFDQIAEEHVCELETRLERIKIILDEFNIIQSQLEGLDEKELENDERDKFESKYFTVVSRACTYINEHRAASVSVGATNASASNSAISDSGGNPLSAISQTEPQLTRNVKLPTLDLPKFYGNYEDWLHFYDTFGALVHNDSCISDINKFYYLISCLKGDAAKTLASLEITQDNYQIAWDLLKERYLNKEVIINTHVKGILDLPSISKESHTYLRRLIDSYQRHTRALASLGEPVEQWSTLLIQIITRKLDETTKLKWEEYSADKFQKTHPDIKGFIGFLTNRCNILETMDASSKNYRQTSARRDDRLTSHLSTDKRKCYFCNNNDHLIYGCEKFKGLDVMTRYNEVKRLKLCIRCLRPDHFASKCNSAINCKKCSQQHNTLLHRSKEYGRKQEGGSEEPIVKTTAHSVKCNDNTLIFLATAIIKIKDAYGKWQEARALLDSGSQSNFITEEFRSKLRLKTYKLNIPVSGISQVTTQISLGTSTQIGSRCGGFTSDLSFLVINRITDELPNFSIDIRKFEVPKHCKLADPNFFEPQKIDVLIGAGLFAELLTTGQVKLGNGLPTLQNTLLGWVVSGPMAVSFLNLNRIMVHCNTRSFDILHKQVEDFWKIEEVREKHNNWSKEELDCEKIFRETTVRDDVGHFVVNLPTRENVNCLGDSFEAARTRFLKLEKRFNSDTALHKTYINFMNEYEKLGHMSKIEESDLGSVNKQENIYYLAHHPVFKESSTTTKVRVVFDGSAKTSTGLSLNDVLMIGPTIQQDLFSILCRFRLHRYVLTADVAKMYRQVFVNNKHRDLQRIVWRTTKDQPLQHYRLNTVTYGTSSASFLAIRSLHQVAHDIRENYPEISKLIRNDFYVDDLLTGVDTIEEAIDVRDKLMHIFKPYGFELRQWCSNEDVILKADSEIDKHIEHYISDNKERKTLGILWNRQLDTLEYVVKNNFKYTKSTKRIILSVVAQIFDPLGLVSPSTVQAKLILQRLWQIQADWDESVPEELHEKWRQLCDGFLTLNDIRIERHILIPEYDDIQIHGFSDASQVAYGACIYLRTHRDGVIKTNLLCAKSRVAPLKGVTLPRLELCGALLLAQLLDKVLKSLSITVDKAVLWCDSMIVLNWINAGAGKWQMFVSNRVGQILEMTSARQWHYVPSAENPADLVSRGCSASELRISKSWWNGPEWLKKSSNEWPNRDIVIPKHVPEVRKGKLNFANMIQSDFFSLYSSLSRLKRVIAYCLRFCSVARRRDRISSTDLTREELDDALLRLVKIAQQESFPAEIRCLESRKKLPSDSNLLCLNPFLDDGILRVGGRLSNSNYDYDMKHPILISSKHKLTHLIIRDEHLRQLHAGPQCLLATIRQRFWILNGLNTVKGVLRRCVTCFKSKPLGTSYLMGNLPLHRIAESKPFDIVGIDFAGPFNIKDGKLRNRAIVKTYLCVFVCFTTKAVHLEIAGDLTADSFLNALKRFTSRRGLCAHIYCDNATNFVGAKNYLKELNRLSFLRDSKLITFCAGNKIQWHFIPARSPHFGGLWEAAVKSAKFHFTRILGNNVLTFEELTTVFVQIESVLNSRPLTPMSSHPDDFLALTPGHFLIGKPLNALPQECVLDIPTNRLKKFHVLQQIFQHFWQRWSKEYMNTLQQRSKWRKSGQIPVATGSLVLLKEENLAPLSWKMGRIIEIFPGHDGVVRSVKVRSANGITTRAVTKICVLPID